MKTLIKVVVLGVQLFDDGGAVLITKPSKENPSANGIHKLNPGQFKRIVKRCLKVDNAAGFAHLVEMSNGTAVMTIEAELVKAGDTYTKADGSTGIYEGSKNPDGSIKGDGSWTKYSNHEVRLGINAQIKLTELAFAGSFSGVSTPVIAKAVAEPQADIENP